MADRPALGNKGFTLIEALIALTVFAIGVLAVISMQTTATSGNARARYLSEATSWAVDRMEIILNLDYDSSLLEDPPATGPGTNARTDGVDNDGDSSIDEADENYTIYDTSSDQVDNDNDGATDEDSEYGSYTVQWRVTGNSPVTNTKTIRVMVAHPQLENPVTMDFIRADSI